MSRSRRRPPHPLTRTPFDLVMFMLPFVTIAVLITLFLTGVIKP
jgi:hypothetical protein